jgi:hypothetical protein
MTYHPSLLPSPPTDICIPLCLSPLLVSPSIFHYHTPILHSPPCHIPFSTFAYHFLPCVLPSYSLSPPSRWIVPIALATAVSPLPPHHLSYTMFDGHLSSHLHVDRANRPHQILIHICLLVSLWTPKVDLDGRMHRPPRPIVVELNWAFLIRMK